MPSFRPPRPARRGPLGPPERATLLDPDPNKPRYRYWQARETPAGQTSAPPPSGARAASMPVSQPGAITRDGSGAPSRGGRQSIRDGVQLAQAPAGGGTRPPSGSRQAALPGNVDWGFIHGREGYRRDIYVPKHDGRKQPFPNSGPTISHGVDLGQMDANDLNRLVSRYGLDSGLASRLTPYLGRKGPAAAAFVAANPLILSAKDAEALATAKYRQIYERLESNFNAQSGGIAFSSLSKEMRTVALSVAIQYGPDLYRQKVAPKFWSTLLQGNVPAIVRELRNFGDDHDERRGLEANYLLGIRP